MARANNNSQPSGKKGSWLVPLLLAIIAAGGSAAGMYFFMNKNGGVSLAPSAPVAQPIQAAAPIFVQISPFTVNLQSERRQPHLLYIGLSLQVSDKQTHDFLLQHMPQLRSRLLMLMAAQKAEELITPNGKDLLSAQILALFQTPLATPQPPLGVVDVLYTDFIVQ